jgi:hypothetical protein
VSKYLQGCSDGKHGWGGGRKNERHVSKSQGRGLRNGVAQPRLPSTPPPVWRETELQRLGPPYNNEQTRANQTQAGQAATRAQKHEGTKGQKTTPERERRSQAEEGGKEGKRAKRVGCSRGASCWEAIRALGCPRQRPVVQKATTFTALIALTPARRRGLQPPGGGFWEASWALWGPGSAGRRCLSEADPREAPATGVQLCHS